MNPDIVHHEQEVVRSLFENVKTVGSSLHLRV
jgi:hypothetical protein